MKRVRVFAFCAAWGLTGYALNAQAACERGGLSEARLKRQGFHFETEAPQGKAVLFRPATIRWKGEAVGCVAASMDGEICFASAYRDTAAYLGCQKNEGNATVTGWQSINLKTGRSQALKLPGIMSDLTSPLFLSDRTAAYVALDAERNRYECVLFDLQTERILEKQDMAGPLPLLPAVQNGSATVWLHAKRLNRSQIGCYQNEKLLATLPWKRKQP